MSAASFFQAPKMPLSLDETRRIAEEVLAAEHPSLRIVGIRTDGGSSYTEIVLTIANCHAEPCRLSIGVQRDMSEPAFRSAFSEIVDQHIR